MAIDVPASAAEAPAHAARAHARWREWLGREGFVVLVASVYGAGMLALSGNFVSTDSWYGLVGGRLVAQHGLPTHDTLTIWAHGKTWVDQQWLGQLAMYGLDRIGGIRLLVLVHVLVLAAALVGAMAMARRRGAYPRSVVLVAGVALVPLVLSSAQVRTQTIAYPLFLVLLVLLTGAKHMTRMRLLAVLALLSLWGNIHGSVVLGAALVALRGAVDLVAARRSGRALLRHGGWLFLTLPWATLLATPYGFSTVEYYRDTVVNPAFGQYLGQWAPSTLSAVTLPLFVLAVGFPWLLGRAGSAYTWFERLAGLLIVTFALLAVRNWVWLSLFAIAFYPAGLDRARKVVTFARETAFNRVLGMAGIALLVVACATVPTHPQSWFAKTYPPAAARTIVGLAESHPSSTVWATGRWADWLLWEDPRLAGRMAFDARYELLSRAQLKRMAVFGGTLYLVPQVRRRYDIVVVSKHDEPDAYRLLRREGPVVYDRNDILVVSRLRAAT